MILTSCHVVTNSSKGARRASSQCSHTLIYGANHDQKSCHSNNVHRKLRDVSQRRVDAGEIAFTALAIFKTVFRRQFRREFFSFDSYASTLITESISYSNLPLAFLNLLRFKKMFLSGRALR